MVWVHAAEAGRRSKVPVQPFADGQYDYTQPWWNNANDRVEAERSFQQGTREKQLESLALIMASPMTRNREIREEMTAPLYTPQFGAMKTALTIDDVVESNLTPDNMLDRGPTDFSGTTAGQDASSFPSIPTYG